MRIAVEPDLEPIAAVLVEEFNRANGQGVLLSTAILDYPAIQTALESGQAAGVLDWEEPPPDDWSARVGWVGIRFAVHPENPVGDLSSLQARGIYLGRIDAWEEIGGIAGKIHALAFDPQAGWGAAFGMAVLTGSRLAPGAQIVPTLEAMAAEVAADPSAIGYLPGFYRSIGIRFVTVGGVAAGYAQVLSGGYPFRLPLYLTAESESSREILEFAGWMQSPAGQAVLMQTQSWE
ncbi:MAG: hypothetical protein JW929_11750 [Anaerolineales bacterium]|nr:hypothetical protein [Anaerolineales bacterium]